MHSSSPRGGSVPASRGHRSARQAGRQDARLRRGWAFVLAASGSNGNSALCMEQRTRASGFLRCLEPGPGKQPNRETPLGRVAQEGRDGHVSPREAAQGCPVPCHRTRNRQHQQMARRWLTLRAAGMGTVWTPLPPQVDLRPCQQHRAVMLLCVLAGKAGCAAPKSPALGKAKAWVRFRLSLAYRDALGAKG